MNTTIKKVNIYTAESQVSMDIADATHSISCIKFFVLEIELEGGIRGQGYLLSFDYSLHAIEGALKDIIPFIEGLEVYETGKLELLWLNESEYFGHEGILRWAQSVVNIAMWDAWGKILGKPIHTILGMTTNKIPIYGSGGWLSYSLEELLEEVCDYEKRGFRAVKIKVGDKEIERDKERISLVREKLGKNVEIMIDANQGMDLRNAIELAKFAESLGIVWFEEPLNHYDFDGYAILHNKINISLAMGEREYNTVGLKKLIENRSIDLWQPDIIRIGGVEAWRRTAALAHENYIPVLPHYYKDYDVPLLTTIQNGYGAESFDWIDGLIDNNMKIENGYAVLRELPGWGFEFQHKFLTQVPL